MHRMQRLMLAVLFAAATTAAGAADGRRFAVDPAAIGAERAAVIARNETGGRVLDVRPIADSGQSDYAVRVLIGEGRVRTIVIDGRSGQIR